MRALFLLILLTCVAVAQGQLEILNADVLEVDKSLGRETRRLRGNVSMKQDSTFLYCDVANQYPNENEVEAISNVRIVMGEVTLYADRATYNGNTRIAKCFGNIRMVRGSSVLTTRRLTYYRNKSYGYYDQGGTLVDSNNVLTSDFGYYYTTDDIAYFKNNVVYKAGDDYVLYTDSLKYEVQPDISHFVDDTRVIATDSSSKMYTEKGWYNAKKKDMLMWQNSWYTDTSYTLAADTFYFNNPQDSGWAHCNIRVWNKDTTSFLGAEQAKMLKKTGQLWLWQQPWLIQYQPNDTLTLFADTLYAREDSTANIHVTEGWKNVQFSTGQLQASSQFMRFNRKDSTILLTKDPVAWSGENQVSGDTILLWLKNSEPDSLEVRHNSFMISEVDSARFYNQIKGKKVVASFDSSQIAWMQVSGNVESIYFMEDDAKLVGMNLSYCSQLQAWFENNEPIQIKMEMQPNGTFFPIHEVYLNPQKLDGFCWRVTERPPSYLLDTVRPGG